MAQDRIRGNKKIISRVAFLTDTLLSRSSSPSDSNSFTKKMVTKNSIATEIVNANSRAI